ncbi:MAG: hypothetical protein HDR23_03155 [Lachnospiraceae bacterium]|nr:hypothetical protein [Lachnospiraceae bacterium]MBD5455469.1 hypothetical protein [Lachnospiraceae bacterium]
MKKKFFGLFLILLLIGGLSVPVYAKTYYGDPDWHVSFTSQKKMESNFKTSDLDEAVRGLQPGDDIIFTLSLQNEYSESTAWWMTNEVLYSLEDRSANNRTHGGAYTYKLTYTDKSGSEFILFDSETIGGDSVSNAGEGLHEATDALEKYFYLDTLATGQKGFIRLAIALDGETQGNDYQDTLADLQMNFAVELLTNEPTSRWLREESSRSTVERIKKRRELIDIDSEDVPRSNIVKTGDETNLTPFFIAMAASGTLILLLAIYSMKQNGKEKEKGAK